jgi:ArsR family transcriptional regulator
MPELPYLFAKEPVDHHAAVDLAAAARALADPARVELLSLLIAKPGQSVTELIVALKRLAQPTVSHHLRLLYQAGLVSRKQDGVFVRYTVEWTALRALSDAIRPARVR